MLLTGFGIANGQTNERGEAAGQTTRSEDEAIVLSPFTVSAQEDRGYAATNTLAGTRLRTSLQNVSTSISVVTQKFMEDTGSTDAKSLLVYTVGTEVSGLGGNFSGTGFEGSYADDSGARRNPAGSNRVRGLAAADLARDYFATNIPFDSYNTSRVEINRGSNAILFGLGSPAGIVNNSTKGALFENLHTLEARYGSFGSTRGVIDINRELVADHLAIRIIGLEDRQKFEQEPAFEDDSRLFLALNLKPFAHSKGVLSGFTIRANYEKGSIDANRPRTSPPADNITPWFQPISPASSPKFTFNPGNTIYGARKAWEMAPLQSLLRNPNVVYPDEHSNVPRDAAASGSQNIIGRQFVLSNWLFPSGARTTAVHGGITGLNGALRVMPNPNPDWSFYNQPTITDPSIFNFRKLLIDGPNKYEDSEFEAWNLTLEQLFLQNKAGIELTVDHQKNANWNYSLIGEGRSANLIVDTATNLIDGTVNTNFGRPFLAGTPSLGYDKTNRTAWRATAFYDLDFTKKENKWLSRLLGRHVLTAVASGQDRESRSRSGPGTFGGTDFIYGANTSIGNGEGPQFGAIHYLGGSLAGRNSAAGSNIPSLSSHRSLDAATLTGNGAVFFLKAQSATAVPVVTPLTVFNNDRDVTVAATSASFDRDEVESIAFVSQSYFWDDLLVGTVGWRKDKLTTFNAGAAPLNPNGSRNTTPEVYKLPTTPNYSDNSETFSWGLALHAPEFITRPLRGVDRITFYYNDSSNFQPSSARFNVFNERIDSPQGTTKDVGVGLSLFDGKLSARATWYETNQINVREAAMSAAIVEIVAQGYVRVIETTRGGFNPDPNGDGIPFESGYVAPPQFLLDAFNVVRQANGATAFSDPGNIIAETSFQSKGFEFEMVYNPTRQWTVALNVARQESTKDSSGASLQKFFFDDPVGPNGQSLYDLWSAPSGQTILVTQGGGTLKQLADNVIASAIRKVVAQDGQTQQEMREWRVNVVGNYEFAKDTFLRGWNIGAAYRWQSEAAIGYPAIDSPEGRIIDVANPHFGPKEDDIDMWVGYERPIMNNKVLWRIQLNVRNLLDDDDLIPTYAQPDGTTAVFRIPSGRTLEMSTRFTF